MSEKVQTATKAWIDTIISEFDNLPSDALNQVYMRGYFAGYSIRSVLEMAKKLNKSADDFPIVRDKELR